jgi:hypothetical protein
MPDQWEYKTLDGRAWRPMLRAAGSDCYRANESEVQDELLNGLGREGWEVCAYSRWVFPFAVMIVLKRRAGPA